MSSNTYIYALADSNTGIVKYIGKSNDPEHRLTTHLSTSRIFKNTPKNAWLKSLSVRPELIILDEVSKDNWEFWERYWISQFKTWGFDLKNSTDGGDGGNTNQGKIFGPLSEEIRSKISKTTKQGMLSENIKAKCRLGASITRSKILTKEGKLRPDIIAKKREAAKKSVSVINSKGEMIRSFDSITSCQTYYKLPYKKFKSAAVLNNPADFKQLLDAAKATKQTTFTYSLLKEF